MKKILVGFVVTLLITTYCYTAFAKDRDNNPPGKAGGRGTNWENKPGPQGGAGASPNIRRDRDNNPPGRAGGAGTNWENRPGPQGGPGAGPNQRPAGFDKGEKKGWGGENMPPGLRKDRDNNPPGQIGGPGTNWENPPGMEGGPGTGPDGSQPPQRFEEWLQRHPGIAHEMDLNNDGTVDEFEKTQGRKKAREKWFENHPELKERLDANKDGVIDEQEKQAARENWQERKKEWIESRPDFKEKMDTNQDGAIDPAERKAAHEAWKEAHPYRKDYDNNPPGAAGGPGTNWENKPGPRGGAGASPNRPHPKR